MSDIIQLLPDNIANQIAAGEVIQRPASVVKELIENAVDAGATKIALHIKEAGRTSIQVIDNGKGMSEMDARMCFERHATSKLKSADDLFQLTTKGFRGEAMASIAAIAHVDLETKLATNDIGSKVIIQGSKVISQEPTVCQTGTSITIKNLFFNVPARRNFLKSDAVETKHIVEELHRVALTHPEIAFHFTHNGNLIYDLQEANLRKRIVDIHGIAFNTKLVPVEETTDIVHIYGFVGKPEFARKTRGEQYFFVNKRFFKDSYLHHAVSSAFDNLIQPKTYPSYFLYLEVNPKTIDVNIHPTKTEIKFEDERSIYSILRSTVKLALGVHNIAPSLDFEHEPQFEIPMNMRNAPIVEPQIQVNPAFNPFNNERGIPGSASTSSATGSHYTPKKEWSSLQPNKSDWESFYDITEESSNSEKPLIETASNEAISPSNSFQVHKQFLFSQVKSGLMCIHIARANERIIYDELMTQFMQRPVASQQLLFPIEIAVKEDEKDHWESNKLSIERLGFSWNWNGKLMVLDGIPSFLSTEKVEASVLEMINTLSYKDIDKGTIAHEMILTLAKNESNQFSPNLSADEIQHIINTLFLSKEHQYAPSGKKIISHLTLEELNKWF